ncbi:MAG: hypothetical protein ACNA7W_07505 [Pseudomonadales bacterium]
MAFLAPLRDCVVFNGLTFAAAGWHPFVATLRERADGAAGGYCGSLLETFFDRWQPTTAAQALIGIEPERGNALHSLPPYAPPLPWQAEPPNEWVTQVESIIHRQNREHGSPDLTIEAGFNHHGPVSSKKGALEYQRLVRVFESLRCSGYDRSRGDVKVTVIRRKTALRYLVMSGHHRAAAAAVLKHERIPCVFGRPDLVSVDEVQYWPLVRSGVWTIDDARAYVDHLFDFDAREWAREKNLPRPASGQRRETGKRRKC